MLGSGALVRRLVAEGLVDAYTLFLHPLLLGTGTRLFGETAKPLPLELRDVTRTSTGVLILSYAANRPAGRAVTADQGS
ncbi:dihydrofolate reductase family protein [Frankia sp. CN6]|uniref:Dihydrofolate reductase family protein n=1 Tax=Frankia nepalensis TaxID=1836974 RepID=A0A937RFZ3_9ACTN|nr:dihydrofolate reductase family protein [Frankia nepalensis]